MNLENMMPRGRSEMQKTKCCMMPFIGNILNGKSIQAECIGFQDLHRRRLRNNGSISRYGFSFRGDEDISELDRDVGFPTLQIY